MRIATSVKIYWVLVISLLLFSEGRPQTSPGFSIQKVENLNEISSLNSTNPDDGNSHSWWVTHDPVDPQKYSQNFLKGNGRKDIENSTNWLPVQVPATIEKQIDFPDSNSEFCYLKTINLPENITEDMMIMLTITH